MTWHEGHHMTEVANSGRLSVGRVQLRQKYDVLILESSPGSQAECWCKEVRDGKGNN